MKKLYLLKMSLLLYSFQKLYFFFPINSSFPGSINIYFNVRLKEFKYIQSYPKFAPHYIIMSLELKTIFEEHNF